MAVPGGKLTPLQVAIVQYLADIRPSWTLSGGAALVGVYLGHRQTRDLDLFWREIEELGDIPTLVEDRLRTAGLDVKRIQTSSSFTRLRVADDKEVVVVDLVADPVPAVDEDDHAQIGTARIRVASRYEILVEKLCALLSRTELRDLQDVQALVDAGTDLRRAVEDAPRRDGGFSPLTMSWVLRGFDVHVLAKAIGTASEEADRLEDFREELIDMLVQLTKPEE